MANEVVVVVVGLRHAALLSNLHASQIGQMVDRWLRSCDGHLFFFNWPGGT